LDTLAPSSANTLSGMSSSKADWRDQLAGRKTGIPAFSMARTVRRVTWANEMASLSQGPRQVMP